MVVALGLAGALRMRGKSKHSLDLIEAARLILGEIAPATVRAVCYRLFVAGIIPSMAKAEVDKVGRQIVYAREQGMIPWHHVVDETREAEVTPCWRDPDALIRAAVAQYRRDHWRDQEAAVEVWSEKGTIRGTLAEMLREYGVTFRVMHGYVSATAIKNIADESNRSSKPLIALYVGDWDPSGLHMSQIDIPARLARYGGEAHIIRIDLTENDIGRV